MRELGYDRIALPHDSIQRVPSTTAAVPQDVAASSLSYFDHLETFQSTNTGSNQRPNIWVYLQQDPSPVNPVCPLAQSYIDVIMRGCLAISHDFCREFLQTTRGWSAHDFHDTSSDQGGDGSSLIKTYWINDRHNPLYVRADQKYSIENADELDCLLKKHRPEILHRVAHDD